VAEWIAARSPAVGQLGWIVVLLAAAAVASPFCIGIARCTAALARALGSTALPRTGTGTDLADAPRRALVVTMEIAILLLVGAPLLALTQPFLPALSGPIVLTTVAFLFLFILWRSTTNLQEHAVAGAQVIVEALSRQLAGKTGSNTEPDPDLAQLHQMLPGLGTPQSIRVRAGTHAVGKTLAELNLRGLTGATVLAIVRQADGLFVPTGRETLRVDDLLAIAGTSEALRNAEELLARED
jgi:CPA2 family monovalent cation:H+ antiporter-2